MKNIIAGFGVLACTLGSHSALAAMYDVTLTGLVSANQSTTTGICRTQGFNVCHYFPLNDSISMTFRFDDSTPAAYIQNGTSTYYDNAIKSISFSSTAVGYTGAYTGDFGQFIVKDSTKDGLTFRFWEPTQTVFASATANAMDLTTLQTEVAHSADDIYGDMEINSIRVNLGSFTNALYSSMDMPTSISLADFDDPVNTNWGIGIRSASGFGGSVGIDITGLSVQPVSAVPVPAAAWLFGSGIIGLIGVARRKKA